MKESVQLTATLPKTLDNFAVSLKQNAKYLLKKRRKDRSHIEQTRLATHLKDVRFFEQFGNQADEVRELSCRYLRFKQGSVGEVIYDLEDKVKHLYVIVEGGVEVVNETRHTSEVLEYPHSFGGEAVTKYEALYEAATCVEACSLAYLTKLDFTRVMAQLAEKDLVKQAEFLNELPMFKDKTKSFLLRLSSAFDELKFLRNSQVFKQGTPPHSIFFVKEGEFMLTQSLRTGQPNTAGVAILCRGETIGHKEVLEGLPFINNCVCVSATGKLLAVRRETFLKHFVDEEMMGAIQKKTELTEEDRSRRIKNYTALVKTGRLPSRDESRVSSLSRIGPLHSYRQQPARHVADYKPEPTRPVDAKENDRVHSITNLNLTRCPTLIALENRSRPKVIRDLEPIKRVINIHTDRHLRSGSKMKMRRRSNQSLDRRDILKASRQDISAYKESFITAPLEVHPFKMRLA
jgi:CRP-like cAMP-binding protein